MPSLVVGQENGSDVSIYYEDHGSGQPVVLIHGYPLDGRWWERQEPALLAAGHRVVAYDRRGFGRSSQPSTGYDFDTFTADLAALVEHLDLRDMVLCGFSMGGGEVVRYLGRYGSERVAKAVLMSAIPPYLLKADDNPDGVPLEVFDGIKAAITADRYAFFEGFFASYYSVDTLGGTRISDAALHASFNTAVNASPLATYRAVTTWYTDFRADLAQVDVPVLSIHGTDDRIVPLAVSAARLPDLVKDLKLVTIEGGPHNIAWTHPDEVNAALLEFLRS